MNNRTFSFFLIAALLLAGLMLVIYYRKNASVKPLAGAPPVEIKSSPQIHVDDDLDDKRATLKPTEDEWRQIYESPINFYGKVVDQDDKPLVDVEIRCSWSSMTSMDGLTIKSTAPDGRFAVNDRKGTDMSFSVIPPEGYRLTESSQQAFHFADYPDRLIQAHTVVGKKLKLKHQPDVTNPVIFKINKIGSADTLYKAHQNADLLQRDGSPRYFSISEPSAKGFNDPRPHSIEIRLLSEKEPDDNTLSPSSWSMKIRVPDGGVKIIEVNKNPITSEYDELLAPSDGYLDELSFNFPKNMAKWKTQFTKDFFFHFSDNTYGRATVTGSWDGVRIQSLFNPTGSRNLLFDETKVVELKKTP